MKIPTQEELRKQTIRAARVFLFSYPDNPEKKHAALVPAFESREAIEDAILKLPGCKETEFVLVSGCLAITVDDQDSQAERLSDEQWCQLIAETIFDNWQDWFEVRYVHTGKFEATYRVLAKSQEEADTYVNEHRSELDPEEVTSLSDDYEQYL